MCLFTATMWILCSLLVPETYAPVLLRKRAATLSKMSGKVYKSQQDAEQGVVTVAHAFKTALLRPWVLLFKEPIVLLLSTYMAIIYGTLYMLFAAYPIVYQEKRGWTAGVGALPFLGVAVGMIAAVGYSIWDNKRYIRCMKKDPHGIAPPEARMPPAMVGGVSIVVGLIWFAWTNSMFIVVMGFWILLMCIRSEHQLHGFDLCWCTFRIWHGARLPEYHELSDCKSESLDILCFVLISTKDAYVIFAASVLAANAVLRSLFGAAFPLFTTYGTLRPPYSHLHTILTQTAQANVQQPRHPLGFHDPRLPRPRLRPFSLRPLQIRACHPHPLQVCCCKCLPSRHHD